MDVNGNNDIPGSQTTIRLDNTSGGVLDIYRSFPRTPYGGGGQSSNSVNQYALCESTTSGQPAVFKISVVPTPGDVPGGVVVGQVPTGVPTSDPVLNFQSVAVDGLGSISVLAQLYGAPQRSTVYRVAPSGGAHDNSLGVRPSVPGSSALTMHASCIEYADPNAMFGFIGGIPAIVGGGLANSLCSGAAPRGAESWNAGQFGPLATGGPLPIAPTVRDAVYEYLSGRMIHGLQGGGIGQPSATFPNAEVRIHTPGCAFGTPVASAIISDAVVFNIATRDATPFYGSSVPVDGGSEPILAMNQPVIGADWNVTFDLDAATSPSIASVTFVGGAAPVAVPLFPASLPGGTLLVFPDLQIPFGSLSLPFTQPFPIPNDPTLIGGRLFAQWIYTTASGTTIGATCGASAVVM
ncbi:MAG: hypothetical protein IPM29_03055 [Planctomycetes bacterium]|nr:hypothetical protein [Planctomycetota bacterium]